MKEYRKLSYAMKAEKVNTGTPIYNFLEDAYYVSSEAKSIRLIGTIGEEWLVTVDKLIENYTFEDGAPITETNIPNGVFDIVSIASENAKSIFAEQVFEKIDVVTSWGEILKANREGVPHGDGDFIAYANKDGKPDYNDRWVINGLIFEKTYGGL